MIPPMRTSIAFEMSAAGRGIVDKSFNPSELLLLQL